MKYDDYKTAYELSQKQRIADIESIYVGGSTRNQKIGEFANKIETELGIEAFADWAQPGPEADSFWRSYSQMRGRSYRQALKSHGADQIFDFDYEHLNRCDAMVLLLPAGKSAHMELGFTRGRGKPGFVVFEEEPERWDVMYKFATEIFFSQEEFIEYLKEKKNGNR